MDGSIDRAPLLIRINRDYAITQPKTNPSTGLQRLLQQRALPIDENVEGSCRCQASFQGVVGFD